jgi:hypothetical protein
VKIARSFAMAQQLGKPLVVGEAGIQATDASGRVRRAALLRSKIQAAFADGEDGYLIWQLNTRNTDGYVVVPGQDEPLARVQKDTAPRWSPPTDRFSAQLSPHLAHD